MKKTRKKLTLSQVILSLFMICLILTMVIPFLNIVARSLSSPEYGPSMSGYDIIPKGFSFINYKIIFSNPILLPSIVNSFIITIVGGAINVILTTVAAYVLTRKNLVFKKAIMVFLMVMMLFDPGLVPEYLVIQKLNLMNSQWSVILVSAVNVYYLVICMRYFSAIPDTMFEAAVIDGAGHLRILFSIYMPLAKAGVATIAMFYAVFRWNDFFRPSIYLTSPSKTTLQVVLRQFVVSGDTTTLIGAQNLLNYNEMAKVDYVALKNATIVVAIIPILLLYPFVLKFYNEGVMAGAIKE